MRAYWFILSMSLCFATAASAQQMVGEFKQWGVFSKDGVCYAGAAPSKQSGNSAREPSYLYVTHRTSGVYEVSIVLHENYTKNSEAIVLVGNKSFKLFTQDNTAWAYHEKTDKALVDAMKKGNSLKVKASTTVGKIEDVFPLSGFEAALKKLQAACK